MSRPGRSRGMLTWLFLPSHPRVPARMVAPSSTPRTRPLFAKRAAPPSMPSQAPAAPAPCADPRPILADPNAAAVRASPPNLRTTRQRVDRVRVGAASRLGRHYPLTPPAAVTLPRPTAAPRPRSLCKSPSPSLRRYAVTALLRRDVCDRGPGPRPGCPPRKLNSGMSSGRACSEPE